MLVAGAGALGNEVVKNLALSGVGRLTLVDMDRVEASNLNRCVLFTQGDAETRRYKAEAAAHAARRLVPEARVEAVVGRVEDLPERAFGAHDVIVSAVDNVSARLHLNAHARHHRKVLVDGGTDGMLGKVQVVWRAEDACVECGVNATHRRLVEERFSCTGREATVYAPPLASEVTTTSVVAAIQAREVVKAIHGLHEQRQRGILYYDGFNSRIDVLRVDRHPKCPHHAGADSP